MPVPLFLKSERLYIFQNSTGFDGMVFHLIAHDPWMRHGSAEAIGGTAYRYRRILVPALAWCLALGHDAWVHTAYYTVILAFVFLGVYWLSLLLARAGCHPAWGLLFVLTPAALTSIDRMTVDIAVAALTVGFALYAANGPNWKTIAVLACAALTKEQAMPILAGYVLFLLAQKHFAGAARAAAASLPLLAWSAYLMYKWPNEPSSLTPLVSWVPFAGLVDSILHPVNYPFTPFKNAAGVAFDYVALAGMVIALALAVRLVIQRRWNPRTSAIYALGIAAVLVRDQAVWRDAYTFGRGFTPLLLLIAIEYTGQPWLAVLPMLLIDSRISLNFLSQILGVLHGLLK
jgi:hypothetical protein